MHLCLSVLRGAGQQVFSIAVMFWAGWLLLVTLESVTGSNLFISIVFSLTLPLLVGLLTWSSRGLVVVVQQRYAAIALMGMTVLVLASSITAVGMVATASLKSLLS